MTETLPGVEDPDPLPSAEIIDFTWLRANQIMLQTPEPKETETLQLRSVKITEMAYNIGCVVRAQYRRSRFQIIDGKVK